MNQKWLAGSSLCSGECDIYIINFMRSLRFKDGVKIYAVPPTQTNFAQAAPRDGNIHSYFVMAKDLAGNQTQSEVRTFQYPIGFLP